MRNYVYILICGTRRFPIAVLNTMEEVEQFYQKHRHVYERENRSRTCLHVYRAETGLPDEAPEQKDVQRVRVLEF